jgi:pSer/pThr/pTyr-binding forkhead associated (FHA) protein
MTVIVVTEGPLAGRRIDLDGELVIGREDAGLTIDDEELSRRHAILRTLAEGVEIEDLGSRNGTFVNGRRIEAATRLAGGDSLKCGRSVFAIELSRAAETVASPVQAAATVAAPVAQASPGGGVPSEPFGALAAQAVRRPRRGIASRQLLPMFLAWVVVVATAAALVIYFAQHR